MLTNLISMLTKSLSSTSKITPSESVTTRSYNPFVQDDNNNNPFLSQSFGSNASYGKNQPVAGGYFAGYYNGKPNIVGRKLFIEI